MTQRENEHENEETLAAIDEGLRDSEAGRVIPAEEVRKIVNEWICEFSARKDMPRG